jgi:hypothetical protein
MADPTLKRTSVQINYTSSDGYRMAFGTKAGSGSKHRVTGVEVPPEEALLAALEELARLTALFGFEDEATRRFQCARAAVFEWRESTRAA